MGRGARTSLDFLCPKTNCVQPILTLCDVWKALHCADIHGVVEKQQQSIPLLTRIISHFHERPFPVRFRHERHFELRYQILYHVILTYHH
jgi:hypothetical protein